MPGNHERKLPSIDIRKMVLKSFYDCACHRTKCSMNVNVDNVHSRKNKKTKLILKTETKLLQARSASTRVVVKHKNTNAGRYRVYRQHYPT